MVWGLASLPQNDSFQMTHKRKRRSLLMLRCRFKRGGGTKRSILTMKIQTWSESVIPLSLKLTKKKRKLKKIYSLIFVSLWLLFRLKLCSWLPLQADGRLCRGGRGATKAGRDWNDFYLTDVANEKKSKHDVQKRQNCDISWSDEEKMLKKKWRTKVWQEDGRWWMKGSG